VVEELKVKVVDPEKWRKIREKVPNYIYFPIPEECMKSRRVRKDLEEVAKSEAVRG